MRWARSGVAVCVGAVVMATVAACGSKSHSSAAQPPAADAADLPPRVCKTPSPPSTSQPWFTDVTSQVGLAATATFAPAATCVVSADFDGDGYPDLLAFRGDSERGLVQGKRVRFLEMNRPDPSDPSGATRIFVDVPDQAGLLATRDGTQDRGASIALVGDVNDDGAVDVVTCPADFTTNSDLKDPCVAFLNDGTGHFTLASASDIDSRPYPATSAVLLDWNRDGILDFWPAGMANWTYPGPGQVWNFGPRLFQGNGDGTFQNVTSSVGLPTRPGDVAQGLSFRRTFGMTSCDIDGDGDQDVLLADYGREENQVWRNDGDHFTNVAHALGLDHDDDENYSDDQSYQCYCHNSPATPCNPMPPAPVVDCCAFCAQAGYACPSTCPASFRGWESGVSDQAYSLGGNNFGVSCVDVNDDGAMDVLFATVAHGDVGQSSDPTEISLNPGGGGRFTRPGNAATGLARAPLGLYGNNGDDTGVFVDVDLDGRKDLYLTVTGAYPQSRPWFWHQKDDGTFEEIAQKVGLVKKTGAVYAPDTQGVDFIDYDGDGDLDLVTGSVDTGSPVHVWRNDVGQDANWVRIRLVGKGAGFSNTSAIGARVLVTAGGRTQTLEVKGGQGIGNVQNDLVLTFGLGATCDIDQVEVHWPDSAGTVTTYANVLANYQVTITEGDATVAYR